MSAKYSAYYTAIGQRIKEYRKVKGLTQEALAEKASISISYLTKIEAANCDKSFSLEVIFDIANALEIPFIDLLTDIK
ncbi:MAG: helix-turn-helix domain-containing protein [Clostridiales Family XIII bacterium]|jgi:transcriptional regulator with XRE-family HTH domain|nr:helix-turn-helix domain-containing protein [Clostridiales Family XIII bacterium]